jgi:uncharacterized protein with PIN domain
VPEEEHHNWFTTPPTRMEVELRRFRCDDCGYGASRRTEPARCPMCGGAAWAEQDWRPMETLMRDLDPATLPMQREAEALGLLPGVPLS